MLRKYLQRFPFIAITRGMTPEFALSCAGVVADAGFTVIETPLNSPDALISIERMAAKFPDLLIGAGTVTTTEQVHAVKAAGGRIIVSPHCDTKIIAETKALGLVSVPGVATPTEAFRALQAGADALKLFPAEMIGPAIVKAMLAVLPPTTMVIPVGGIDAENWLNYHAVGASAFGLGSSLYTPKMTVDEIKANAAKIAASWNKNGDSTL